MNIGYISKIFLAVSLFFTGLSSHAQFNFFECAKNPAACQSTTTNLRSEVKPDKLTKDTNDPGTTLPVTGLVQLPACPATQTGSQNDCIGALTLSEDVRYEGEIKRGSANGLGTLFTPNGDKYVGQVRDGVRHGEGVQYTVFGSVRQSGIWKDGRFDSYQKLNLAMFPFDKGNRQTDRATSVALEHSQNMENTNSNSNIAILNSVNSSYSDRKANGNRKGLVIGNDSYTNVSKLDNAVADAAAMDSSLRAVGFNVSKYVNVGEKEFKAAIRKFRESIKPGDEVVVFFAGHGVQLNSTNYLLPVDVKGESEAQIRDDAIQLQRILDDLQESQAKFSLAVIDACRDNPFKGLGRNIGGRGLAPTNAANGQMIIFSAGSGQQALDKLRPGDAEKNSVFTRVFKKEMLKPGLSIDRVLRNVRNEVVRLARSVGHDQTPALYDQTIGEFYFNQ
ncbi:MAG: hypothetical protein RL084_1859 [Pseudomonadota bacterium]|jgi:hypothetical protein